MASCRRGFIQRDDNEAHVRNQAYQNYQDGVSILSVPLLADMALVYVAGYYIVRCAAKEAGYSGIQDDYQKNGALGRGRLPD